MSRKTGTEIIPKEPDPGNAGVGRAKRIFPTSLVIILTKLFKMKKLSVFMVMLFLAALSYGQFTISGEITDEKGAPLAGASVVVKNTYNGVSADAEGKFTFKNLQPGIYKLVISFIGYEKVVEELELESDLDINVQMTPSSLLTEEVIIAATRIKDKTPMAYSTVSGEELQNSNLGQDIPYLLALTPSFVATSDAGAGVGYTNFRIRGTDLNRINVSVDGVPITEGESHGTWFVDLPDLASSTENIHVQRGVGTSTNGAGAFGATIDIQTLGLKKDSYGEYTTSMGSFSTFRNTVSAGSGLIKGKFTLDARISKITSDGFIDRATSDLQSFYVAGSYYSEKTIINATVSIGMEETYQAWNGVPSVRLNNDEAGMQEYADNWLYSQDQVDRMKESDSRTYNLYTYNNQVDHYQQDYYRLHFSHKFNSFLYGNATIHYRYGRGYYEQYEAGDNLSEDYRFVDINGGTDYDEDTDLVRRKWLDNDFYGIVYSLNYNQGASDLIIGGGYNVYDGRHFGKLLWAENIGDEVANFQWYFGTGLKKDFNIYSKYNFTLAKNLNFYADLQYRYINYKIDGIDDDFRDITQKHTFNFFNPKFGVFFKPSANQELYASYARANREPNRDNYTDADPSKPAPTSETLNDFELGYTLKNTTFTIGANAYLMNYKDQLILTGEINDVGGAIMTNVEDSYRSGIELMGGMKITNKWQWDVNATFSKNKISDFTEYVENWDSGNLNVSSLGKTDIALSPNLIANSLLKFEPAKNLVFTLVSSYVGDQYIDNTSNEDRKLDAYLVNNLNIDYSFSKGKFKEIALHFKLNNFLNEEYESTAWVYSYITGGTRYKMDGLFPQAGINYLFGIDFKF